MADDGSSDDAGDQWVSWYLSCKGNEILCEVDHEYITDRFNLTGLFQAVPDYQLTMDLILDQLDDDDLNEAKRSQLDKAACHLYGLIHARFILTGRGQHKMMEKFKAGVFGQCPRALCDAQAMLPVGLTNQPFMGPVYMYCPRCEDIYHSRSNRHSVIDGAYFGTTFPHLFLLCYPNAVPVKTSMRYEPTVFGFRINDVVKAQRQPPKELVEKTESQRRSKQQQVQRQLMDTSDSES